VQIARCAAVAASLPNIRLHDLRHSCATLLLAQGVNPRVVMETLGHSQVSLTLNSYSHVLPAFTTRRRSPDGRGFRQVLSVSVSVGVSTAGFGPEALAKALRISRKFW
jgi:hypothetical protein